VNITPSQALLIGAVLISATIWFGLSHEPYRFQAANFAPGVIAIADTKTGGIELCGNVEPFVQLSTISPESLHNTGTTEDQIAAFLKLNMEAIQTTHCFILSDHSGM
jgi:hypothetical protein